MNNTKVNDKDRVEIKPMGQAELDLRKAFEETTIRNVSMIQDFSNDTRRLVRKLEEKVQSLQNNLMAETKKNQQLQQQIAFLLQEKVNKGS